MYMAPIVRARPASSPLARRLVGAPVLIVSVAVMAPWLAVNALVSAVMLGGGTVARAPRVVLQAIDYAGEVALGR